MEAARIPSLALLDAMIGRKRIHGRYDSNWHGSELPIPTGCAQLALCWHALWELTKDTRFLQGSRWIMDWSIAVQRTSFLGPADVHGALPGSFPLWGRYEKFAFPNWATKYFVDALLCVEPLRSG